MLPIFGSRKTLCDGFSRRDLLHVGSASALGLSLAGAFRAESLAGAEPAGANQVAGADGTFGRAKACILIFLFGSPPQHETFDPKPSAPAEIQGEMKAISTSLPGYQICEGLPRIARIADRLCVVRSMTHPYPVHGVAYALTGMPTYTPAVEARPRDPLHRPYLGSIVDYLDAQNPARSGAADALPRNLGLPWQFGSKSTLPTLAGPYASFLGSGYDPVWTDYTGAGTIVVPKLTDGQTEEVRDPFGGSTPDGRFQLASDCRLPGDVTPSRLDARRLLLQQFNRARAQLEQTATVRSLDPHQQRAWSLLTSSRIHTALDIHQESPAVRERYGPTLFGQALLAARRIVEQGGRFVSVFWDPFGPFGGSVWDTHANHFPRLKNYLLPVFDQSFSALVEDLEQRGLLDSTAVLCTSEHGRTPQIDSKPKGAARHHWSRAYSSVFAGGGFARGRAVGRTDPSGGDVADVPVSPKDMQATAFHLLGIDPHTQILDQQSRPVPIAGDGRVREELLG
ncbi:MAG TPA: DUF1501 domain-containing protein [Pirellulaceae bacterium]|nr:DUF1501 domain-containing protein [Pirellulaceae bacterium]